MRIGVLEHKPFQFGKVEVCRVVIEIGNLLGGDAACPANGRADIDSKRASDERRDAQLSEPLESAIDQLLRACDCSIWMYPQKTFG